MCAEASRECAQKQVFACERSCTTSCLCLCRGTPSPPSPPRSPTHALRSPVVEAGRAGPPARRHVQVSQFQSTPLLGCWCCCYSSRGGLGGGGSGGRGGRWGGGGGLRRGGVRERGGGAEGVDAAGGTHAQGGGQRPLCPPHEALVAEGLHPVLHQPHGRAGHLPP